MDFLELMNYQGLLIGLVAFILIGVFHPVVIHAEYRYGKQSWPFFLFPGLLLVAVSLFLKSQIFSVVTGVLAFALFWSTFELFKQHERVLKGRAKKNPKRDYSK